MNTNLTIIVFVAIVMIGRIFSSIHRKTDKIKTIKNIFSDYTALIILIIQMIFISLPIIEYYLVKNDINPIISGIGGLTIFTGFLISFFANKEIGTNWSASIEKDNSQKLITSGIYKYIWHPLYFFRTFNIVRNSNIFPILVEFNSINSFLFISKLEN